MTEALYIVGDIGGTHARFACVDGRQLILNDVEVLPCSGYDEPSLAIQEYIDKNNISNISGFCLAFATPVGQSSVKLTNNHWKFEVSSLSDQLGAPLMIINDFAANAYALNVLRKDEYQWLNRDGVGKGVKVILGPGTGFGVCILTDMGEVMPSEGGHVGFAPHTQHENLLLAKLIERYKRVSIERVLSGDGLSNLYWGHNILQGITEDISPSQVVERANTGDTLAQNAIRDFFNILASFVSDTALMSWAVGGVYLTGGVLEKLWPFYNQEIFLNRLTDKGRFSSFCQSLPVARIIAEHPGMLGCAYALRQKIANQ